MQEEIWKDVVGYEGLYKVSNMGNIRSLPNKWVTGSGILRSHNGKILKISKASRGYYIVGLRINSISKTKLVHQLVAESFLYHKPCGMKVVVDHINDDKSDNRVENLQIVTQRHNVCKTQGRYSSQYKGVHWAKNMNKWRSSIIINNKYKSLGYFTCELEASNAYQNALKLII